MVVASAREAGLGKPSNCSRCMAFASAFLPRHHRCGFVASPQRVLALGQNRCFDDWCIAVDDIVIVDAAETCVNDYFSAKVQAGLEEWPQREKRGC